MNHSPSCQILAENRCFKAKSYHRMNYRSQVDIRPYRYPHAKKLVFADRCLLFTFLERIEPRWLRMILWFDRTFQSGRLPQMPVILVAMFSAVFLSQQYRLGNPCVNCPASSQFRPRQIVVQSETRIDVHQPTLVCRPTAILNLLLAAQNLLCIRLAKTQC
jgi:hypothetical protein